MKKHFSLPLFWKFSIAIAAIVAVFGSTNLYLLNKSVYQLFESELTHHGLTTAKIIAERSVEPILYDDLASLNNLVTDQIRIDSNFAYVFILDNKNNVLAHTFKNSVPSKLIEANFLTDKKISNTVKLSENTTSKEIRDMAIPILNGTLGVVRVGLYEENYTKNISTSNSIFIKMVLLFLFFGISAALFFAFIITTPIKYITETSEKFNLQSFDLSNYKENGKGFHLKRVAKWKNLFSIEDEIDVLILKYNEMVLRLKDTYIELQATQDSFVQTEKMASLGTLSAGVAHEINNPIAGIKSCIRRISKEPENVNQNIKYFEMISEAVNKIENVVGGLLKFSRKQELVFSDVNLLILVENVLMFTAFQLEKSRIIISKNSPLIIPTIKASVNHIEQLVLNLLLNSIDAIDEKKIDNPNFVGEIKINILTQQGVLILEISDNGIGIPPEKLKTIFDPFFTSKKIRQGTGLGLAVCYRIMEQHGGKIVAKQNEKDGITFAVIFNNNYENKQLDGGQN